MKQFRNDYSLTFPPLYISMYSFIQLSRLRRREENENAQIRNGSKGDSNPGSLDCGSGIVPLSYCAPHKIVCILVILICFTFTVSFMRLRPGSRIREWSGSGAVRALDK